MISATPLQTLKNIEFRNLLTGRFFLVTAFRMLATVLGWWIYSLAKNPLAIGMIGLAEVIPAVSFALYGGHIIDIKEKKRLLLICSAAYIFLISLLLFPANDSGFFTEKKYIVWFIYAVIFSTGIARAFLGPIVPAMIPKIVKKENLPSAITLNQATFLTASVFGHAIGGFLIAKIEVKGTLLVIVALISAAFLAFTRLQKQFPSEKIIQQNISESIKEGIRYIFKTKEILGALCLDMFAVLFGGAVALIPVFATDILKVGAEGFGILNAASDIGSMMIIITLSFFPLKKNQGKILLGAVAAFGLCIIGFGSSKMYWLSFLFLMMSGIVDGISVVIRGTVVQLKTPDEIRGRVLSANSIFIMSSNEMGQFESGLAAKFLGPVKAVVYGGITTVMVAVFVGLKVPELRKMEY